MTMNELIVAAKNHGYITDGQGNVISPQGRKISTFKNPSGYLTFNVVAGSARGTVNVHRFIAYLLFGEKIFQKGIEVRHLNGNSIDNRSSNLSFGTSSENKRDIPSETRSRSASIAGKLGGAVSGAANGKLQRKLTNAQVEEIKASTKSLRKLAEIYNVSKGVIDNIKKGKSYID